MHLECGSCDRVFTKTEHLRRHERSHTKEKPFVCHLCSRAYARSDVLARHLRMHARKEQGEQEQAQESTSDAGSRRASVATTKPAKRAKVEKKQSTAAAAAASAETTAAAAAMYGLTNVFRSGAPTRQGTPSAPGTPFLRAAVETTAYQPPSEPMPYSQPSSNYAERALAAARPMQQSTATSNHLLQNYEPSASDESAFSREAVLDFQAAASVPWTQPQYSNFPPEINQAITDDALQIQGLAYRLGQGSAEHRRWPMSTSAESYVRGSAPAPQTSSSNAMAPYLPMRPSQSYYNSPNTSSSQSASEPAMNRWLSINQHNNPVTNILNMTQQPETTSSWGIAFPLKGNTATLSDGRYAKVEQGWYTRMFSHGKWATAEKRWYDVLHGGTEDLFASCEHSCEVPRMPGQRARVSEACRLRMMRALFPTSSNLYNPASKLDYTADLLQGFPTCADFDGALETYFQKFTKEAPFFHIPVFSISTCDPLLLLTMSCVGFGLGNTPEGSHFVQSNFDDLKDRIMADLERKINGITLDAMSAFATAFIFLKLAALFANRDHLTPCQMLYICMVNIAQTHGIFTDYGKKSNEHIFSQFSSVETTWKAWGRVESLKRIVISMLRSDSAYCTFLRTAPIMRVNNIEMLLPCDDLLFDAPNHEIWWAIVKDSQYPMIMPALSSQNSLDKLIGSTLNFYALHTVLNYLSLRGTDAYQKLQDYQANHHDSEPFVLVPYKLYQRDEAGRNMIHHYISFIDNFQSLLPSFPQEWQRCNCLVFWHYLCLSLTMNSDLMEITAGRAGGQAASFAATFTKSWVQTPAARRALLHSAQVYTLLSNKQQTDMRSIYACFAVFQAALVMTLYVFASSEEGSGPPGTELARSGTSAANGKTASTAHEQQQLDTTAFEVTDLMDWAGMGAVGLDADASLNGSAAARWIAEGGHWQFRGRRLEGFAGAIYLLDIYSDLLQTCGKWNYSSMSRILVSMRDLITQQPA